MCAKLIEIKELCEKEQKYGERRRNSKFSLGVWAGAWHLWRKKTLKWELSRAEQSFFGGEKRLSRAEQSFFGGEKRLSRVEQSFFGGEKRLSRAEHDFLQGREETFACGTWFSQAKNLSVREMTLDKEKSSLTCKKTLAKKYKYDRI